MKTYIQTVKRSEIRGCSNVVSSPRGFFNWRERQNVFFLVRVLPLYTSLHYASYVIRRVAVHNFRLVTRRDRKSDAVVNVFPQLTTVDKIISKNKKEREKERERERETARKRWSIIKGSQLSS